jgi:preprotein translocase subunit SecA
VRALDATAADVQSGLERDDAREPFFDRLLAGLGYYWHSIFARIRQEPIAFASDVARCASHSAAGPAAPDLSSLRYRLRRDGLQPALVAECFGHYCAALSRRGESMPGTDSHGAALILLEGGIAELAGTERRRQAIGLAATTWAIYGVPVHVVTASDARSQKAVEALQPSLTALGFRAAPVVQGMDAGARRAAYAADVVCASQREIGHDYLRDRLALGGRRRPLASVLQRLSGGAATGRAPTLRGLQCALVEDADIVLVDDAHLPLAISGEAGESRVRLVYEQALELARALTQGGDFTLEDDGPLLTDNGKRRVERLVGALGGIWAARKRREELIALALDALHLRERDVDYRVEQGRVALTAAAGPGAEPTEAEETLQRLIEVKEGCRLGERPDVRARLTVPRFFRRYLHLAGACASARGSEGEFWTVYGLKTVLAGAPSNPIACRPRVFATVAAKRAAIVSRARAVGGAGGSLLIAVRTPVEARALSGALAESGVSALVLQGSGSAAEGQALERLGSPGGVALAIYPAGREMALFAQPQPTLNIVVAELHDARRHIETICRAFEVGTCEMLLSLEDDAVRTRLWAAAAWWARRGTGVAGELTGRHSRWLAAWVQRGAERASAAGREDIRLRDHQLDDLLAFTGNRE